MSKYIGKVINIGSSSNGNAFYIEIKRDGFDKTYGLLLEAGFDVEHIAKRLLNNGANIMNLNTVLITHNHNDHSKGIKELASYGIKVFAPQSVFDKYEIDNGVGSGNKVLKPFVETAIADGIKVLGLPLQHKNPDGSDCENLGYIITIDNTFNILFITDTKYISWNLRNYKFDMIFIEANNKIAILKMAIKNAQEKGEGYLVNHYERVLNSHMTVEGTAKTLSTFDLSNTKMIYLIHLTTDRKKNERDFIEIVKRKLKRENKRIPPIVVADHRGFFIK